MKSSKVLSILVFMVSILLVNTEVMAKDKGRGSEGAPVVFVTSQGLYYDSIALGDLPIKGGFQELVPTMHGLTTEYGPGEVGHRGGRCWIDLNGDGMINHGDKFFLCPLLGPGRTEM